MKFDMNRVLLQSPWTFDKYLLVLHRLGENECIGSVRCDKAFFWVQISNLPSRLMTKANRELIGCYLGEVVSVDAPEGGRAWGTCMRVRVKMDITKPLCRGRMVRLGGSNRRWVSFQYKRLPIFCYWFGKLDHDEKDCHLWIQNNGSLNKDAQPYGPWLRASPDRLQKPQVVRVSGQDTHQVNHGTKSPGNLCRTAVEQVGSTGDTVQHKVLSNNNISETSSPPVHHVPKDSEFPSIQKISAIPIDLEARKREIDRALEWKVSEMVEKDKEISDSISPLSNDVASKSNGADTTPLHGPALEGPQGEVNKVPIAFVMGPGDNFTQVANSKGGIVHVQPKKSG